MTYHPMFSHIMNRGTAAKAPYMALSRVTKTCVSRYKYWMSVNAIAAGTAARRALPYFTSAFGMNLYMAENVNVATSS